MAEITIPDQDGLLRENLGLSSPTQVNRSTWTGRRKVIGLAGAEVWQGAVTIDSLATELEERPWRAFLFGLRGPENHFKWHLPRNSIIGPKPVVDSGATAGYTLPLTGMLPSATHLRAGQFMTVPLPSGHSRAVCLTADLVADASGDGTATFTPALNEVPDAAEEVETARPYIPMAPVESVLSLATVDGVSGASFDVEEAM